ncbi:hypothetical protein ACLESD_00165 [Pyxidicoccus sp. 3LFB2]
MDIPLRNATVPLQITVADGGEDGRVKWEGGADSTDYFPARFCVFQSKAQNLTEALVKKEVLKAPKKDYKPKAGHKSKKDTRALSTAISDVLSQRGAYIIFCSREFTGQKIEKLRKAIESTIRVCRRNLCSAAAIEIYDANRIADWVNTHPPVALWLAALHRRRPLAGFLTHEAWGRGSEIADVPWVPSDVPRFIPVNRFIHDDEHKHGRQLAWTFEQAAQAALKHLAEDKAALRITGPSGFGKSRFAFQLFNRDKTASEGIEGVSLIYADATIAGDESIKQLALDIADAGAPTILVVDECPDETHQKLAAISQRSGSRLRLVTIDVETRINQAKDTLVVRLESAGDQMIREIARAIAPSLGDSVTRFIAELAKGFPRMAVLAAQQDGAGRQTIRSAEQVLDRIIWGRRQRNDEAQRSLEVLSLFEWVGLRGRVAEECFLVARKLAGIADDVFIEHIKSFESRGIVTQRGDFAQVTLIPLAAHLGAHRLSCFPHGRLEAFFVEAPHRLKVSLLRRLRWLDTSADAKAFARKLLGNDELGNLSVLNTDSGAECLDHLVHVDPDLAMTTIQQVFGGLSDQDLRGVDEGRRHLIWALEKLAFRKSSFNSAATLLRRLAAAEVEEHFSNNATGQFKKLYQLYLSGTEAPPLARLLVLDDGLRSDNLKEREVCVEALGAMLATHHFSRSGGAEEIGSGEPRRDWAPTTYGEIWEFHRAAIKRLTDIATSAESLSARAKSILGSHIRGLISQGLLDDLKVMVSRVGAYIGFWPEAVKGVNEWLYFDRRKAPADLGKAVRTYFDELMPSDPVELAVLYTYGWRTDFHDPNASYDEEDPSLLDAEYVVRKATEVAEVIAGDPVLLGRALDRFVSSDAKTVFSFAHRLAELVPSPWELFVVALAKAEAKEGTPNRQFFGGLISGTDGRDPKMARDCIRAALRSEKFKKDAISLIGASKLQPSDIQLVVSLLQAHEVQPWQCASLSYGRGMEHLPGEVIVPLLEELTVHGPEGLWACLDIISMVLHGGKELTSPLVMTLRAALVAPELFEKPLRGHGDGHHLKEMVKVLAKHGRIDRKFAQALVRQFLGICDRRKSDVFHSLKNDVQSALKTVMGVHPKEVWANVARLLQNKSATVRHRLESLLGLDNDKHLEAGLLYNLPRDLYLDWARRNPSERASVVMKWLPIVTKSEDGTLSWHSALEEFVAEFGNQKYVLDELSSRLHPRVYWGSAVPQLEPLLPLLRSWSAHSRAEVRHWASGRITWIRELIQQNEQERDEDVVRFS